MVRMACLRGSDAICEIEGIKERKKNTQIGSDGRRGDLVEGFILLIIITMCKWSNRIFSIGERNI